MAHLPFTFTPIEQRSTMWTARQNESSDDGIETHPSEIKSKPFSFFSDNTSGFKFCTRPVRSSFPFLMTMF